MEILPASAGCHVEPVGKIGGFTERSPGILRVCHIVSGDLWAGVEVMDYHLLKLLKEHENIELSAILLNEGKLSDAIRGLGIRVDVVDEKKRNIFQLVYCIRKILDLRSVDLIHSHRYKENVLAFLSSKFGKEIQLVATQHGIPEILGENNNRKYKFLHRLNIFLLRKYFRQVIAVSRDIRSIFINTFGFSEQQITVIHNGTDIPTGPVTKNTKESFVIGSMGRIFPVKDYLLMVEVAREISGATDKIRFELAGDGPDASKIESAIERYRLWRSFRLLGTVEDLPGFYRGIDLYLNTSLYEGIPMTVLEAMSYGIPVVAPNVGGLKEMLVNGKEGYLVNGREPEEFAKKCLYLYNNRTFGQSMGAFARKRVEEEFSNTAMAREYHSLYRKITGDSMTGAHQ